MSGQHLVAMSGLVFVLGCGGGTVDSDVSDAGVDASNSRSFALGFGAHAYRLDGPQRWVVSLDNLQDAAGDDASVEKSSALESEAVLLPVHLYGIPWSEFGSPSDSPPSLPGAWVAKMQELQVEVQTLDKRLILAMTPLNQSYDNLAPEASDDGTGDIRLTENWLKEYCPNPSNDGNPEKWARAYSRYVSWMVELFKPEFVGLATSINLYEARCEAARPGAYASLVEIANRAHKDLKREAPGVTTFTGVQVEDLYGYPRKGGRCPSMSAKDCLAERKHLVDPIESDRLGLDSYPAIAVATLKELPGDWLSHVANNVGQRAIVIAGVGMPAEPIETVSGVCVPWVDSTQEMQRDLLDQAISITTQASADFLVWYSMSDLYSAVSVGSCACSSPKELCDHLEQLGGAAEEVRPRLMQGLLDVEGGERLAGALWRSLFE